jgi:hypothetical protein
MSRQHISLDQERWSRLSLSEQMANIGSEVERAITWKKKNNPDYCQKAFFRALELIDLTLDSKPRPSILKEVGRVREALVDFFFGTNQYHSSDQAWQKYFYAFQYAARKHT